MYLDICVGYMNHLQFFLFIHAAVYDGTISISEYKVMSPSLKIQYDHVVNS